MIRQTAIILAALSLGACDYEAPPPKFQHITCNDKFSGEFVFSFDEATGRDAVISIGGSSYATYTTDAGKVVQISEADINERYACTAVPSKPNATTPADGGA